MSVEAEIIFDDTAHLTVQGNISLNPAEQVVPPPCHLCLKDFEVGDEVLNIVSRVSKAEGMVLAFIHVRCRGARRKVGA